MTGTHKHSFLVTFAMLFALAGSAAAQTASPQAMPGAAPAPRPAPYLGEAAPGAKDYLPPPPAVDSTAGRAELQIFHDTRALAGSARWDMAARDAAGDSGHMWSAFSCALGADISAEDVPLTATLIQKVMADVGPIVGQQKNFYDRPRPFTVAEGDTCVPAENLAANGSYPSGHSTVGWTWALLLADLAPDRAGQIIGRGRAFAESRVVCGVHYPSDLIAGQTITTAIFVALQGSEDFIADRNAAQMELSTARTSAMAPDAAGCAVEAELVDNRPW